MSDDESKAKDAPTRYQRYQEEVIEDIIATIQEHGCQPILFVGSGLSKRYFGAPSWDELLSLLAKRCSLITKDIAFYRQSLVTATAIGEEFAKIYHEWAWDKDKGSNEFPDDFFTDQVDAQFYLKYIVSKMISELTPTDTTQFGAGGFEGEVESLKKIRPHAVITTNYDRMLEGLFPDLEPIVGQKILKSSAVTIGEIFKIHGCISDPDSIVITETDYTRFAKKKKYLSAKLLTFFNEHPLIFIGYSASDPNIKSILADIDEALPEKGGLVPNVYILQWNKDIEPNSNPPKDKVLPTIDERSIRVKMIEANDFSWVFEAFAANPSLNDVNPRVLRALIARSYELVRHDIPKIKVHANFQMLTDSVVDSKEFAKLFGIANVSSYSAASATHPFSPTQMGERLGQDSWHITNQMIDRVTAKTGTDIKSFDNRYHISGYMNKTKYHKYSEDAYVLLVKVRDGQPYDLQLD